MVNGSEKKSQSNKSECFHVIEQFGFDNELSQTQLELINIVQKENKIYKFFPIAGVARSLDEDVKDYQLYSFLPMQQRSPIDCHVNGFWALEYDNRRFLFNSESKTHVCAKWNQALIDNIILPLYMESLNNRIEIFKEKLNPKNLSNLVENYLEYFPREIVTDHSIKIYFEGFNKSFYARIKDMGCVPILDPNTKQVKWQKPQEILFSKTLEEFETEFVFNIHEICEEILQKIQIKTCEYNNLLELFESVGKIKLKCITWDIVIEAFKKYSNRMVGLRIDKSIFKNHQNLLGIFRFCLAGIQEKNLTLNYFEGCPMLLDNDDVILEFSSSKPIIYIPSEFLAFFKNSKIKFLNKIFFNDFSKKKSNFIREIAMSDLETVCESLLPELKVTGTLINTKDFETKNSELYKRLNVLWNIIYKILSQDKYKDFNKANKIKELQVIKDWALIPVSIATSGSKHLLKVSEFEQITDKITAKSCLFNVVNNLGIPFIDQEFLLKKSIEFIPNFVMDEEKADEILTLLKNQGEKLGAKIGKNEIKLILSYFNNKIHKTSEGHYSMVDPNFNYFISSDYNAKSYLNNLPIFEDWNENICSIGSNKVWSIETDQTDVKSFPSLGLEEFCLSQNLIIVKKDESLFNLYSYLDFQKSSFEQFYSSFFNFFLKSSKSINNEIYVVHINFIRELSSRRKILKTGDNSQFWNMLGQVPFIKIKESYYCCNQLYDPLNDLFKIGFQDLLLPIEYLEAKWREVIYNIGFISKVSDEDLVKLAFKFESLFAAGQVKMEDAYNLAQKLISSVDQIKKDIQIETIAEAKFIPNFYEVERILFSSKRDKKSFQENLLEKSTKFSSHLNMKFVNLKDSVPSSMEKFCWFFNPILPLYFDDYSYQKKIDPSIKVDNFLQLLEILAGDFLEEINFEENSDLKKLFESSYKFFTDLFKDETLRVNLERLKDAKCILNLNKNSSNYQLSLPKNVFRDIKHKETIEGFVQNADCFVRYWELFRHLGAQEKITFDHCRFILESIARETEYLSDSKFDDVLIVYKFLFIDGILTTECPEIDLFAPNLLKQMLPLKEMFFMDESSNEELVKSEKSLQELIIFDLVKLLKDFSLTKISRNHLKHDADILRERMIQDLSTWKQVVSNVPYFVKNPNQAARPVSELISFQLEDETSTHEVLKINSKIHSVKFTDAIFKCLEISNATLTDKIKEFAVNLLRNTIVYSTDTKINGFYVNSLSGERIRSNKKQNKLFVTYVQSDGKIKIIYSKKEIDNFLLSFWLAQSISNEIKKGLLKLSSNFHESQFVFLLSQLFEDESNDFATFRNCINKIKINLN